MIFIYEKTTGEVKAFYQGDMPQIHNFGSEAKDWAEAQFPDDPEIIQNPHEYKIIAYNGLPITYQKKPKLELTLDKEQIIGDGNDVAVLKAEFAGVHPLEMDRYKDAEICINGEPIIVENGEEIELASFGPNIVVNGDMNVFRGDVMRRITVGKKSEQAVETSEIQAMQNKLNELEAKIAMLTSEKETTAKEVF